MRDPNNTEVAVLALVVVLVVVLVPVLVVPLALVVVLALVAVEWQRWVDFSRVSA